MRRGDGDVEKWPKMTGKREISVKSLVFPHTSLRRHSLSANPGLHKRDVIKAYWGLFSSPRVVTEKMEREQKHDF